MSDFTADHHGFYQGGRPFFPLIQEEPFPLMDWSNAVFLRLPASLTDDLAWKEEKERAKQIALSGKYILWEIDLGLSRFQFTPENSAAFFSFSVAIEEFAAHLWPPFQKQTFGVVLYRGGFPTVNHFPIARWEPTSLEDDLYCIQMLSEYLHRLVSFLPDSVLPFALFDVNSVDSPGKIAQLLSKERFEHVQLGLKGVNFPFSGICWDRGRNGSGYLGLAPHIKEAVPTPSLGIYLPKDDHIDPSLICKLDRLIAELNEKQTPFRIIPEEKLTEQWDGVDTLILPSSEAISKQGKRKLLGFIAAGGSITIFEGEDPFKASCG
jgi:hypothetical protein